MTTVVREPVISTVVVDDLDRVIVSTETTRVVTVGVQGPPGATGPAGPQGPSGTSTLPAGADGSVVFKENDVATLDGTFFRYNSTTKTLEVAALGGAVVDGGNF